MATGTFQVHGHWVANALSTAMANLNFMFSSNTGAVDPDLDFENDITNEVTGTNVPAGGIAATGETCTYNTSTNTITCDIGDLSQGSATATGIRQIYLVDKSGGSAATNRIVASTLLDSALSPNAGTLSVTIDSAGVFTITV
jgi:hypothetical protein